MYHLKYSQRLPLSLEECWNFFSSPHNLKILTPPHLSIEITNHPSQEETYSGQIICYTLRPLWNLPISWVTEITHLQKPHYFIDEQRFGPYKFWHHEHRFFAIPGGVEIIDLIDYKMPFWLIGKALHHFKIKEDLESIFSHRKKVLEKMFGSYNA